MKNLHMVDLSAQYEKIHREIQEQIQETLTTTQFINGPKVEQFASSLATYLSCDYVIPCANGTDALQIALMAVGLQPGDEVIVPSFTYVATAEVIALLKLTPIMIDVDPQTFNVTAELIEPHITEKTKAIVPVHLFGQNCDLEPILALARRHDLWVIEDAAQSIGADYTFSDGRIMKSGTMGHIGCTSFFPSKNLGCYGDGGAIFTRDAELAQKLKMIANHGQSRRYYHEIIGVNSRLDALQAGILQVKLAHLDEYGHARYQAAQWYHQKFADNHQLITPYEAPYTNHVYHQYTLQVANGQRDGLDQYLTEKQIPHAIYYPVPLYEQNAFSPFRGLVDYLPVTDQLCKSVISLPIHTEMDEEMVSYIADAVNGYF
ncbi:MAG: DegT/DnrJ/EryC1/StrS family aminotransferase [Saprospiraceae bacterium]|nr:DegT/DnrJ/EryC1/StrS family aminotransferase [Saprospiraceae bacterium]